MCYTRIPYTPRCKPVITFISIDMISDDKSLDKDTSNDIAIVKNTPRRTPHEHFSAISLVNHLYYLAKRDRDCH